MKDIDLCNSKLRVVITWNLGKNTQLELHNWVQNTLNTVLEFMVSD